MSSNFYTSPARQYDHGLDFVRVAACLAVVLLHVSARPIYMQGELSAWGWLLGNAVSSLTHWCVPVFVMLSAALLLGDKNTTFTKVLSYRVPRMLLVLTLSISLYALWIIFYQGNFNISDFMWAIVKGQPYYHLHFFYLIIGLYFVAPILSQAVASMGERDVRNAVIATCFLTMVTFAWSTFSGTYTPNGGSFSWPYISYFLLGYYLYKYRPALPYGVITAVSYLCTVLGTQALAYGMGSDFTWKLYFYSYFSPTVFAMSIGVWGLCFQVAGQVSNPLIKVLSPLTLLVYIIHPIFMELFRAQYGKISQTLMAPIFEVPLTFVLTILFAFFVAFSLRKFAFFRRFF